jgi:hypothetical protein
MLHTVSYLPYDENVLNCLLTQGNKPSIKLIFGLYPLHLTPYFSGLMLQDIRMTFTCWAVAANVCFQGFFVLVTKQNYLLGQSKGY